MHLTEDAPLLIAIVSEFVGLELLVAVSGEEQVRHLSYTLTAAIKIEKWERTRRYLVDWGHFLFLLLIFFNLFSCARAQLHGLTGVVDPRVSFLRAA